MVPILPVPRRTFPQALRSAAIVLAAALLTACAVTDGLLKPQKSQGGAATQARPAEPAPSAPGSALPYSASPRQTEAARTASEKQLAADAQNFRNVVMGGYVKNMIIAGPIAVAACLQRHAKSPPRVRNECLALGLLTASIVSGGEGYKTAKVQEAQRDKVRAMKAVTDDMAADNAQLQAIVDASETVLAESQERLRKLREDVRSKRVAADQARQEAQREQESLNNLKQALKDAQDTRAAYLSTRTELAKRGASDKNLDKEIAQMNAKIAALEANIKKLGDALQPFAA